MQLARSALRPSASSRPFLDRKLVSLFRAPRHAVWQNEGRREQAWTIPGHRYACGEKAELGSHPLASSHSAISNSFLDARTGQRNCRPHRTASKPHDDKTFCSAVMRSDGTKAERGAESSPSRAKFSPT